ncbi:hypothetical protein [Kineococcus rhizosphaerae]|uniref:Uncharacterized protein n=1 Tax=Kineococcus rhizosphaerae TaxID=559628 RepID=A0A2T0RB10_9ACTN|nr:hypothetical protein [Kineococcus rhizosphaerae]PRY18354.1 hypothetical protein CLV37_101599 [Kineococcus rhizosphaerae]
MDPEDLLSLFDGERYSTGPRTEPGFPPRALWEIGYESHVMWFIELVDDAQPGSTNGALWTWGFSDPEYRLTHLSLIDYVEQLAEAYEQDRVDRRIRGWDGQPTCDIDQKAWVERADAALDQADEEVLQGRKRRVDASGEYWPDQWLISQGIDPDARAIRGADVTIAQLRAWREEGRIAAGTVHARVRAGKYSPGVEVLTLDDGTGSLRVLCTTEVMPFPLIHRARAEFEVTLLPWAAEIAAGEFVGREAPLEEAWASAVRPLPG